MRKYRNDYIEDYGLSDELLNEYYEYHANNMVLAEFVLYVVCDKVKFDNLQMARWNLQLLEEVIAEKRAYENTKYQR